MTDHIGKIKITLIAHVDVDLNEEGVTLDEILEYEQKYLNEKDFGVDLLDHVVSAKVEPRE